MSFVLFSSCLMQHCPFLTESGRHVGNGQRWPLGMQLPLVGGTWKYLNCCGGCLDMCGRLKSWGLCPAHWPLFSLYHRSSDIRFIVIASSSFQASSIRTFSDLSDFILWLSQTSSSSQQGMPLHPNLIPLQRRGSHRCCFWQWPASSCLASVGLAPW